LAPLPSTVAGRPRARHSHSVALLLAVVLAGTSLLLPPAARAQAQDDSAVEEAKKATSGLGGAPLSTQERAAVGYAILYLRSGAKAWQKQLSANSIWSSLSEADAIGEIAARVGPPDGARWQLQRPGPNGNENAAVFSIEYPSGMTETIWLELVGEGGTLKLRSVKTLSEAWPLPTGKTPEFEHIAAVPPATAGPGPAHGVATAVAGLLPGASPAALLALAALATFGVAATTRRRSRAAVSALLVSAVALACQQNRAPKGPAVMRSLVPLREALAEGASGDSLQPLLAAAPREGEVGDIARLWRGDRMLRDYRLNEAESVFATFPDPAPYPLVAILRARLAVMRGDANDSLKYYEQVRELHADDDGMRLEAAIALANGDKEALTDRAFGRLTAVGSRMALPYYAAAENAIAEDHPEEAERLFKIGWELQPLSREVLFRSPLIASVCTRREVFPLLQFGAVAEPLVGGPVPGDQPLPLPEEAKSTLVGKLLRIQVYSAEVRVPGGAVLAPANTVVETAEAFERSERDEQVALLAELTEQAAADGAYSQPALRRRLELAASGLADQERWADLLALTARLPSAKERLPPDLTRLRALALVRSDRPREAFELLLRLAGDDKLHGRRDTGTLYQLADTLVREQRFDLALKVLHRANDLSGLSGGKARERQVRMEEKLAKAHELYESKYFRIRYPKLTGREYAAQLGVVLDEERKRLSRWIPVKDMKQVDVDLYPVEEFLSSYAAEMPVVGIFDGRVRVPFADLRSLHPQLVAILSHELAHALITQATGDRAPKWVQEGLAQHVQMVQDVSNPFPDLESVGHSLSLNVVEQALGGFSEPQFVQLSYAEAAWTFHYLEAERGVGAIHKLLAAYAVATPENDPLQVALGTDASALDASLRAWAAGPSAPKLWPSKLRRYDDEAERLARMAPAAAPPAKTETEHTRFANRESDRQKAMLAWHSEYVHWAQPLKEAYTPVRAAVAGKTWGNSEVVACRRLADLTSQSLARTDRFQAPDPRVAYPLRNAILALNAMGLACGKNDLGKARVQADKANALLTQTASVLQEYKLPL